MAEALGQIEVAQVPAESKPLVPTAEAIKKSPLLANLREISDFAACLEVLLLSLSWRGQERNIAEAMPHFADELDLTGFRNVMANLQYSSRPERIELHKIDPRLMPCLFVPDDGAACIPLARSDFGLRVFSGGSGDYVTLSGNDMVLKGTAYFFKSVDVDEQKLVQQKIGWFWMVMERFRSLVYQILGLTLLLNLLALATPLFVMAVYDKVVATGSMSTLAYFGVGVSIAIICDYVLRKIRTRIFAFVGARIDHIVGNEVFKRIMFLPPAFTERATIGAQVARIKDFESVRDFFTGPMAVVLFEIPFSFIFITVIFILGGAVAIVPIFMLVLFWLVALAFGPMIRDAISATARFGSKRQELVIETISSMRAIKYTNAEETWLARYRELSAQASMASFKSTQVTTYLTTISHVLMITSGVATIGFGVFRVFDGVMTIGGLVASMILVWRVLGPLQSGFVTLTRVEQVRSSITQINNLMNINSEHKDHVVNSNRKIEGFIEFGRVSLRYSPEADPALVGVNFDIKPGEVLAILGGNGSGKSTILKLLLGMYVPQAGSIRVDQTDIRQLDPVELRQMIGYAPQTTQFFYGTIAQNLRLSNPAASDEEVAAACEKANVLKDIEDLPKGFWTRIGEGTGGQLPTSFQQRLNLARCFIKNPRIMLFDEPGNGLDFDDDQAFMRTVSDLKETGVCSFIVTHRPSHLKIADKILWLENGHMKMYGPTDDVKPHLPKDFL
ncbi:ATP-binding cassette domain-containing protein [Terasakiella sp. A23]|uniref:peptidase domain-containing ABC transporter n=1 Tax=Terasakiella sp. FCG-A23 TaxID=3080561 RepID=UPI00295544F2|nr:ATP-binding cassette domain-containing protein [Terasakiella sp. A23]MDV7340303.1 ATP-binding cassette domain-containing protein [Terasakiella sp. A23]